jgi:hypothetical protein
LLARKTNGLKIGKPNNLEALGSKNNKESIITSLRVSLVQHL